MKKILTVLSVAMLLSCSDDNNNNDNNRNGSSTVTGSVFGLTLTAQEALSMPVQSADCERPFGSLANASGILIWLSNVSGTCDSGANACRVQPNALTLVLIPWNAVSSGTPPAISPGVYPITPNAEDGAARGAFAAVLATDASCNLTTRLPGATEGNVTITAVRGSALTGSFAITLTDGETVTGSFDTVECDVDPAPVCNGALACTGALQCR